MKKGYKREQIENIVLQTIIARPFQVYGESRVYQVAAQGEAVVVKELSDCKEVTSLMELEEAMQAPEVGCVFIDFYASITTKGLKTVLERSPLKKDVFCAFPLKK